MAKGRSKAELGQYHYGRYGQFEPDRTPTFATGGSGLVGGWGTPASQLVSMGLSPSEMVNVSHGDSIAALANAVRHLRRR
jgi:hypothetical protein